MNRPRSLGLWIRSFVFVILLAGCALGVRKYQRTRVAADLPSAPARKQDFPVLVKCRGELVAQRSVQLSAPLDVPDLQILWLAPTGSVVKAGQIVIKFDPSKAKQDLAEKTAALRHAQASLDQAVAEARNTAEQDKLDLAKARYDVDRARLEASKQGILSAIEGQEKVVDLGLAEEKLKVQAAATKLHEASSAAKIASLQRLRDEAKTQLELTQHRLSKMDIASPLDGVINYMPNYAQGWMNAQPFKVGDHAVPGGTIAEIPDLSTMEMESKVDEVDRGRIAVDDLVMVHVDAFPETVVTAKLTHISALAETSFAEWPPTRSFKAYAQLVKPDARLRPSMNAGADIVERKIPNAISVPAKAVFTVGGKPSVYVKQNGNYVARNVQVVARNPDEVAVEGLEAGTLVALTDPTQKTQ